MKTQLIAIKSFSYGGRALKAGGEFGAKGKDARLLVAIGKATYQTRALVAAPPAVAAPAPAPADAPVAPPAPPAAAAAAAAPAPRQAPAAKKAARKTAGNSAE